MNRQQGYYWVKCHSEWQIGRFSQDRWYLTYDVIDGDGEFSEINETRIPSPDEFIGLDKAKALEIIENIIPAAYKVHLVNPSFMHVMVSVWNYAFELGKITTQ